MRWCGIILLALAPAVAACGKSYSTPSSPSPGTTVSIVSGASTMTTTAYAPNPITVSVGGTVTWVNNDNTTHTATGNDGLFDTGNIAPGASYSRTFTSAGSFAYHCTQHPGMVGTVNVQ